jgi:PAS domain S-box-containing protein
MLRSIPPQPAEIDPTVYHSLFNTLQAPIFFIDGQTAAILDANPAACAFYGYSRAELTGKTILDLSALTPEESRQRVSQIAAGETTHMHTHHRMANGGIRDVGVLLGRHVSKGSLSILR